MAHEVSKRLVTDSICLFFALFYCVSLCAQSSHNHLRKGDAEYDKEHYKDAEKHYRDAAELKYGDPMAQYNLGNALYQQGRWEDAATRFEQAAAAAANTAFKADALHNLGNAQLKQNKFGEAVQAYEKSLRLRPGDAGTKQNLQMAKKKLREEQQQQQQQQQNQQKQDQPPPPPNNQQEKQQPNPQQQPEQQQQQQPEQQQPPEAKQEKLKKEEARRLLETAIGPEDQKNTRKYREQRQQPRSSGKEKDW